MASVIPANPSNRTGYIGGSEIKDLLNIEPWGCARRLYYSKSGFEPDRAFVETGPIKIGNLLEAAVADEVADMKGWKLRRRAPIGGDGKGGHIDRLIVGHERGPGVLEIKVIGDRMWWSWVREGIAEAYLLQLQWYMHMGNWAWGAIGAMNRDTGAVDVWEFDYEPNLMDRVDTRVNEFWYGVLARETPEALDLDDPRCESCQYQATCRAEQWGNVAGIDQRDDLAGKVSAFQKFKALAKQAEAEADLVRAEIEAAMRDTEKILAGPFKVQWRVQESYRVDTANLKQQYPEIYQQCTVKQVTRPFRVYEQKEK